MKEDKISSIANEISSLSVIEFDNLIKECEKLGVNILRYYQTNVLDIMYDAIQDPDPTCQCGKPLSQHSLETHKFVLSYDPDLMSAVLRIIDSLNIVANY